VAKKQALWAVACEGHTNAWVSAVSWEEATVKAAEFWGVPWGSVAAYCEEKKRIEEAPKNVCCRCGKILNNCLSGGSSYIELPPFACRKNNICF